MRKEMMKQLRDKLEGIPALSIVEDDYSNNRDVVRNKFFPEEILKIKYDEKQLSKNRVKIPVYYDETQISRNKGGKFIRPDITDHGCRVYTVKVEYGKNLLNKENENFIKINGLPATIEAHIYYDYDEKKYKVCEDDDLWEEKVKEAEEITDGQWVYDLINDFFEFLKAYWSKKEYLLPKKNQTYGEVLESLNEIQENVSLLYDYHEYLLLVGEIKSHEHRIVKREIKRLEESLTNFIDFVSTQSENEPFNANAELLYKTEKRLKNEPSVTFQGMFKTMFEPAFYIDPFKEILYPNVGLIYTKTQKAPAYRTEKALKDYALSDLDSAKKTLQLKIDMGKIDKDNLEDKDLFYKIVPDVIVKKKKG